MLNNRGANWPNESRIVFFSTSRPDRHVDAIHVSVTDETIRREISTLVITFIGFRGCFCIFMALVRL